MSFKPDTVGIAGAGTMGLGIAQVCALRGYQVFIFDPFESSLKTSKERIENSLQKGVEKGVYDALEAKDALSRIGKISKAEHLKADIIIEAIPEDLKLKQELFATLEEVNSSKTVLATNTSSIPVTQIGNVLKSKQRFIGIHFFNPAHIMKLVEVIRGEHTSPSLAEDIKDWIKSLGKVPALANDSPGFIVNRVARSFYTESLLSVEKGAATFESVDRLMTASGFRMGPFKLMDLIGIDTNHSVTQSIYEQFYYEPRFRPSLLQNKYVNAGKHGKKSGSGFYDYEA